MFSVSGLRLIRTSFPFHRHHRETKCRVVLVEPSSSWQQQQQAAILLCRDLYEDVVGFGLKQLVTISLKEF